ncbi:MAG: phosphoribosyl-AMP cyclohydrolase [Nitrososphaerota archaeon]|nr:phosphoribosyl-AMP cyclohydrolase [Nitrososphaerota archaeon]
MKAEVGMESIKFDERGLVPVIVHDFISGKVLMQAYANSEAIRLTAETGYSHFWSRSRKELWLKGETSGNRQRVHSILVDCDGDSIIYSVDSPGPACHTGNRSCFYRELSVFNHSYDDEIISEILGYYDSAKEIRKKWVRDDSLRSYRFILNPITENVPPPSPRAIAWIVDKMDKMIGSDIDKIVVPESLGLPVGALIAEKKGRPLAIVRKRSLGSEYALLSKVDYRSGYETGTYYIYGVAPGERIALIDDTISTGGTIEALLDVFQREGVKVADVGCIMSKEMYGGRELIRKKFNVDVHTLIHLSEKGDGSIMARLAELT